MATNSTKDQEGFCEATICKAFAQAITASANRDRSPFDDILNEAEIPDPRPGSQMTEKDLEDFLESRLMRLLFPEFF